MRPQYTPDFLARFWAKVDKTGDCWLWTGCVVRGGYGMVAVRRKGQMVHRVSWELANGPIPDGMQVCHRCDNPPCVRPDHLWLGTAAENIHDRDAKGHTATGLRNGAHTHPERLARGTRHPFHQHPERRRGERNGFAKLSGTQVLEIRHLYALGGVTHRVLAKQFGIAKSVVTAILNRQRWNHI